MTENLAYHTTDRKTTPHHIAILLSDLIFYAEVYFSENDKKKNKALPSKSKFTLFNLLAKNRDFKQLFTNLKNYDKLVLLIYFFFHSLQSFYKFFKLSVPEKISTTKFILT